MSDDPKHNLEHAHAAMDSGDLNALGQITSRRGPYFMRRCFQYAVQNELVKVAYWFLEQRNYRKNSRLHRVVIRFGHQQRSYDLWVRMNLLLSRKVQYELLQNIHPRLADAFMERGLLTPEPGWGVYCSLLKAVRCSDPNMKQIQEITSAPMAIAAMADPIHQRKLRDLIEEICKWRDRHPWQVIRCLLQLVTDFHAQDEWIAHRMILLGCGDLDQEDLISLLEEYRPNLLACNIDLLANYSLSMRQTLHRSCEGKSFQLWGGYWMRCIVSEYPIEITCSLRFHLDYLFVYSRGIEIIRDDPVGKLSPINCIGVALADETTTEHQAILTLETDGVEESFPVYIPDFLLPATVHRKQRVKSARSAILD